MRRWELYNCKYHQEKTDFWFLIYQVEKECYMGEKRKYTIYAVDFDGTLCENVYPGIGAPNLALIEHLKKRRRQGNKIILWTCREGERLLKAVDWCWEHGLAFDAVNENLPEMIEWHGNDCRKIFADVYIDDKSVNKPKYHVPYREEKCHD